LAAKMSKSKKHAKKISVDLRGFHIFDDGDSSSDDDNNDEEVAKKKAQRKALKERFKHAKKMSVDLGGYHLFDDGDSSDDDENENGDGGMSAPNKASKKKMHNKKISVDLRGFDLFDDSDSDDDDDSSDGPGKVQTDQHSKSISAAANANFKKAQKMLSKETEEDDDLKGFHLFDEYNDDDDSDDVIKLHEMEQGQLEVLVRNLLIENAILKDAASRARQKLDSRKEMIKSLEANKMELVKSFASELNNMRDIIRSLGGSKSSTPW